MRPNLGPIKVVLGKRKKLLGILEHRADMEKAAKILCYFLVDLSVSIFVCLLIVYQHLCYFSGLHHVWHGMQLMGELQKFKLFIEITSNLIIETNCQPYSMVAYRFFLQCCPQHLTRFSLILADVHWPNLIITLYVIV